MFNRLMSLVRPTGLLALSRRLSRDRLTVLMYHGLCDAHRPHDFREIRHMNVPAPAFRAQMMHLKRYHHVVSLTQAVSRWEAGESLPPNSVAITFDDGYENNYRYAWPVCRELELPFTVYAATDFIDRQGLLWNDRLALALQYTGRKRLSVDLPEGTATFDLSTEPLRSLCLDALLPALKVLPVDVQHKQVTLIESELDAHIPLEERQRYKPCTWEQLKEMADSGLCDVGSHTVSHAILGRLSTEKAQWEIESSKARIETMMERPCLHFCYPNGGPGDYSRHNRDQVAEAGYKSSTTAVSQMVSPGHDPLEWPRLGIYGHQSQAAFEGVLAGFHGMLSRLKGRLHA